MKKVLLLLVSTLLLTSSCATIFTGTKDTIHFNSSPEGATVYKDGVELCTTPCSSEIKRSLSDEQVEFKLDGYDTKIITLDREFNVVSVINLTSLLGWAIDAATGSIMKYDKKAYDIELEPDNKSSFIDAHRINIDSNKNTVDVFVVKQ